MKRYILDRVGFQRVVQATLPCLHFMVDQSTSDQWRLEQAMGYVGPYSLAGDEGVLGRGRNRLLNRLLWRQQVWNQEVACSLRSNPADLGSDLASQGQESHLLMVVPHDVSENWSGGSARLWGLCQALAAFHRVTLLTIVRSTKPSTRRTIGRNCELLVCPLSDAVEREIPRRRDRYGNAAALLTMGDPSLPYPLFDGYLRRIAPRVAAIIVEEPYLYERLRVNAPDAVVIYDMPNVTADYLCPMAGLCRDAALSELQRIENSILTDARLVVCVSDEDERWVRKNHAEVSTNIHVAPNGVQVSRSIRFLPSEARRMANEQGLDRPIFLFLGTMLDANRHAVRFIQEHLAGRYPEVLWVVVGWAGPAHLSASNPGALPDNLVFTGAVSEAEKEAIFALSQVAVAPMAEGTGSSLKIPDYMAHGKPVIATPIGLRGFEALSEYVDVVPLEGFQDAVGTCLKRLKSDCRALDARAAKAHAEVARTLDWDVIAGNLRARMGPFLRIERNS